jgi:hypothetical protein
MKKATIYILFTCLLAPMSLATYYEITTDTYTPGLTLQAGDSLYMTDGGLGDLNMFGENATATIEGTSDLEQFSGGIWNIELSNGHLDISGGQVHMLDMGGDATAFLSGGLIQQIWSGQHVTASSGPHITIECLDHSYDSDTNLLTGHWLDDGTAFSIYLIELPNYTLAINNIQFVPEPATLMLLGIGGLLIHRKK